MRNPVAVDDRIVGKHPSRHGSCLSAGAARRGEPEDHAVAHKNICSHSRREARVLGCGAEGGGHATRFYTPERTRPQRVALAQRPELGLDHGRRRDGHDGGVSLAPTRRCAGLADHVDVPRATCRRSSRAHGCPLPVRATLVVGGQGESWRTPRCREPRDQLVDGDRETVGEDHHRPEPRVYSAALDARDLRGMKPGSSGQLLLGPRWILREPQPTYVGAEPCEK
jgi:hypothetical protein